MGWSQKLLSRAGLDRRSSPSSTVSRSVAVDLATGSSLLRSPAGPFVLSYSRAGYQAHDPLADTSIVEVDGKHAFAVVLNADFTARGASYLSRNLAREISNQIQTAEGDLSRAFLAAISTLDSAFRKIHPFNGPVLEGVRIAAVYLDVGSRSVHLASNGGGARATAGSTQPDGSIQVSATVGNDNKATCDPSACTVQRLQLDSSIDTLIVGSPGLWHEVSADNALLRMSHYYSSIPAANDGNAAAHLINHALHAVTARMRASSDPRMHSLRSVQHLQSLWVGDKTNIKSRHNRQLLRRRRGDVHGDLSAFVLHLDWHGNEKSKQAACKLRHSASTPAVGACANQSPCAAALWNHVRMHFVDFPRAAKQQTRRKWHQVVHAALEQATAQQHAAAVGKRMGREIMIGASSHDFDAVNSNFVSVSA